MSMEVKVLLSKDWKYFLLQSLRHLTPCRPCTKESETVWNVKLTSQSSARWLEEETNGPSDPTIDAEVLLVRKILAWITVIILLIAILIGIYFLMNMPLIKDTLLNSNVKLD